MLLEGTPRSANLPRLREELLKVRGKEAVGTKLFLFIAGCLELVTPTPPVLLRGYLAKWLIIFPVALGADRLASNRPMHP